MDIHEAAFARIYNVEQLEELVDAVGFLPLFAGEIPGFSVEEHTPPEIWWSGSPENDPWMWRESAARRRHIAYGKFFGGRAGFISRKWLPVFANYRRDGYDFDARWDDELASYRQKKIMDLFMDPDGEEELFSYEVKSKAGFGKDGEKNFEGTLTSLEMLTYLVCADFRQRKNRKGEYYGWHIAVLALPEHLFGEELVRADYDEDPKDSLRKIVSRVREFCPAARERQILKLVAGPEDRPSGNRSALPYPRNLLKALDKSRDPWEWSQDQIDGLYVALGQLRPKLQRVLREKYREKRTNGEIGAGMNRAAGTIGTYHRQAMDRLRDPLNAAWYYDGYRKNLAACAAGEHWTFAVYEPGPAISEDDLCLRLGLKVDTFERLVSCGIYTVRELRQAMAESGTWYRGIYGVGAKTAEDIAEKMRFHGFGR